MLLKGIKVLDFGRYIAGPYCAALLGDLGADVIRIERVLGGEDRTIPRLAASGEGGMFLQMNRNKRCLTLDLASTAGRDIVRRLVKTADVVVANLAPKTLTQLGLDYATLSAQNPRLVVTIASAYGPGGPYSDRVGFDSVGQAMSGAMAMSGGPDAPSRALVNYVDLSTAQACAMGTLAALMARERSGRGQLVEGALLRSALIHTNALLIEEQQTGRGRIPQGNRGITAAPVDTFRVADGWIVVHVVGQPIFERWCRLVGKPEWIEDERLTTDESRGNHGLEISAAMAHWCKNKLRSEVLLELANAKIPSAPVYSLRETLVDEHVVGAGMLSSMSFPGLASPFPLAPHPVQFSDAMTVETKRAPLLGEHTGEILAELGFSEIEIATLRYEAVV